MSLLVQLYSLVRDNVSEGVGAPLSFGEKLRALAPVLMSSQRLAAVPLLHHSIWGFGLA